MPPAAILERVSLSNTDPARFEQLALFLLCADGVRGDGFGIGRGDYRYMEFQQSMQNFLHLSVLDERHIRNPTSRKPDVMGFYGYVSRNDQLSNHIRNFTDQSPRSTARLPTARDRLHAGDG